MHNKFFWAAVVWTIFITYFCLTSPSQIPNASWLHVPHKDKVVHFIFYFVFTLLWSLYLWSGNIFSSKKAIVITFLIAVIFGIFIEICQGLFTTNRSADVMDALANTAGSATAVLALWFLQKRK